MFLSCAAGDGLEQVIWPPVEAIGMVKRELIAQGLWDYWTRDGTLDSGLGTRCFIIYTLVVGC